ncbi:MAG: hypothetical protein ABSD57_12230 [Verrucomicrobiota bacterium]|jgi:hypothetical protein
MGIAFRKVRYSFEAGLTSFCLRYEPDVFFWNLTFAENLVSVTEAKKRFRCVCDLVRRKKGEYYGVWERQKRGAWHLHLLVNVYFEWHWFQKWLMARGWGEQLYVERVRPLPDAVGRARWLPPARYLSKYLLKQYDSTVEVSDRVS